MLMIRPSIFFERRSFGTGVAVVAEEDGMVEKGINGAETVKQAPRLLNGGS